LQSVRRTARTFRGVQHSQKWLRHTFDTITGAGRRRAGGAGSVGRSCAAALCGQQEIPQFRLRLKIIPLRLLRREQLPDRKLQHKQQQRTGTELPDETAALPNAQVPEHARDRTRAATV
jgi:hypothetical protein